MIAGFVDPSFGPNIFRGGAVTYLNQAFGTTGNANDDGRPTTLPSRSSWEFKCTRFYNLAQKGVRVDRSEGHDPQAWQVLRAAGWEAVAADLLETLDAAHLYGIKCIFTLGGLSDPNTWQQAEKLLDTESAEFRSFQIFMARIADALHGHPALKLLEALNEADFRSVIKGHWLKLFPQGRMQLLRGYAAWQVTLLDGVRELQLRPGTPLGNGTAMDGTLYCDPAGNAAMPWGTNECIYEIIPLMAAGCDAWSPHIYQNEDNADHLLVYRRDKVPSFVRAAQAAGMELIVGEAGALWRGGVRTEQLQAVYDAYPDLVVCWMIRSWDPKIYIVPDIPARVPYSPAPETPSPVEPSVPDPPPTAQEPEAGEPTEDPAQEPPPDDAGPPEAEGPAESPPAASEGGQDPETVESTPSPPETGVPGRGLIFAHIIVEIARIIGRLLRGHK